MNNGKRHQASDRLKTLGARIAHAALWLVAAHSAAAAVDELALTRLTDHVSLITGAGGNVVVLETPDGLALVDSGVAEQTEALLEFIDIAYDGAPVRVLFNTHWHLDHTGGNAAFADRGATIVAHENTRLWMDTEYYVEWERKNYQPRPAEALPTQTFYSSDPQPLLYELGGMQIEYAHLPQAHTDGDIYVRFVDDDVLVAGDAFVVDTFPLFDYATGGWIGGLQASTTLLMELASPDTIVVPGDGASQSSEALRRQSAMLDELRERFRVAMNLGKSADEMLDEGITEGYESFPNARQFVKNAYEGLWWGGRVRGPI